MSCNALGTSEERPGFKKFARKLSQRPGIEDLVASGLVANTAGITNLGAPEGGRQESSSGGRNHHGVYREASSADVLAAGTQRWPLKAGIRPKTAPGSLSGKEFEARYPIVELLDDSGSTGTVYVVKDEDSDTGSSVGLARVSAPSRFLACKVIDLKVQDVNGRSSEKLLKEVEMELKLLLSLPDHPNLVKLLDYCLDNEQCRMNFSLLRGGTVGKALEHRGSFAEEDARRILECVLKGLVHLHKHGIAHRDLKLENVVLVDENDLGRAQIIDLGMAKRMQDATMHTLCGTPLYVAPEVVKNCTKTEAGKRFSEYGFETDLWSCGVMLYMMLSGYPPFNAPGIHALFKLIASGGYNFDDPVWEMVSDDAKDLVRRLLATDPLQRPTAEEALKHQWMSS